jgi:hypothetical protein
VFTADSTRLSRSIWGGAEGDRGCHGKGWEDRGACGEGRVLDVPGGGQAEVGDHDRRGIGEDFGVSFESKNGDSWASTYIEVPCYSSMFVKKGGGDAYCGRRD